MLVIRRQTKKETEIKKGDVSKDEGKKPEVKVEETKKEGTKAEERNKEEGKPEVEVVKQTKKTKGSASEEKVQKVLDNEEGKLSFVLKKAKVVIGKDLVEAIFGEKAGKLGVAISSKAPRKDSKETFVIKKALKGERSLVSKQVIQLNLKTEGKSLKTERMKGEKISVSLSSKLNKAPNPLYVMNVKIGKLMKAKYNKKTKILSFKTNRLGKFVVVKKK